MEGGSLSFLHILESPATQVLISSHPQMGPYSGSLLPADGRKGPAAFDFSGCWESSCCFDCWQCLLVISTGFCEPLRKLAYFGRSAVYSLPEADVCALNTTALICLLRLQAQEIKWKVRSILGNLGNWKLENQNILPIALRSLDNYVLKLRLKMIFLNINVCPSYCLSYS